MAYEVSTILITLQPSDCFTYSVVRPSNSLGEYRFSSLEKLEEFLACIIGDEQARAVVTEVEAAQQHGNSVAEVRFFTRMRSVTV